MECCLDRVYLGYRSENIVFDNETADPTYLDLGVMRALISNLSVSKRKADINSSAKITFIAIGSLKVPLKH